jgi:hypothetical protein
MKTSLSCLLLSIACVGPAMAQTTGRPWDPIFGPAKQEVSAFCHEIASTNHDRISIAVLPFVYADRQYGEAPWQVTDGGVMAAEGVVKTLRAVMPEADILSITELELRFADLGHDPCTFQKARAVRDGGHNLGVDLILYGTIVKRGKDGGASFTTELQFEVTALPVRGGRTSKLEWTVGSQDSTVLRLFEGLGRQSTDWSLAADWEVQQATSFGGTMDSLKRQFSSRVGRAVKNPAVSGGGKSEGGHTVEEPGQQPPAPGNDPSTPKASRSNPATPTHPKPEPEPRKPEPPAPERPSPAPDVPQVKPPIGATHPWNGSVPSPDATDCNVLVAPASFSVLDEQQRLLLDLRADYDIAWHRVVKSADQNRKIPDPNQKVTLNNTEYASFPAAKAAIDGLADKVHNSKAGAYCDEFSRDITAALVHDGGKLLPADKLGASLTSELTACLQKGNLGDPEHGSLVASLVSLGLGTIVVPYLEDCGSYYALRARIVNLQRPTKVHTVFVTISSTFKQDLAAQLGG